MATNFKSFIIEKIQKEDYAFTLGEVALIAYFSRTSSGNVSSGNFAKFIGIPADMKSIEIWRAVREGHDYIGKFFSVQNYKNIITNPSNYDSNTIKEYTKVKFKASFGVDFDFVFKK